MLRQEDFSHRTFLNWPAQLRLPLLRLRSSAAQASEQVLANSSSRSLQRALLRETLPDLVSLHERRMALPTSLGLDETMFRTYLKKMEVTYWRKTMKRIHMLPDAAFNPPTKILRYRS